MARYRCRNDHQWTARSSLSRDFDAGDLMCPECGATAEFSRKRSSGGNGLQAKAETAAHREARLLFNRLVLEWPCWAKEHRPGHVCRGPKDAHHLVPKEWIGRVFSDLPEDELLAIKFEPLIGASACRFEFHDALERRSDVILLHELDDEVRLFCQGVDERYPGHQSMLARLELESPPAREVAIR